MENKEYEKLPEIEKPNIREKFIDWFLTKLGDEKIYVYPSREEVEALKSDNTDLEEKKDILIQNYLSLVKPTEFNISQARMNGVEELVVTQVQIDWIDKKKYKKFLDKKKLSNISSKLLNLQNNVINQTPTHFTGTLTYLNLLNIEILIKRLNNMLNKIDTYTTSWPNPVDILKDLNAKKAKKMYISLKEIVKKAEYLQKEIGPRKRDNDYILERKAKLSKSTSIWEFFFGNKRYQDVSNATKDDEYSVETLLNKSKRYRNQLKTYLENIPGAENNKNWNLLDRRLSRLQILLTKWIAYFTKKPKALDARTTLLMDLNKTIKKLEEGERTPNKNTISQEDIAHSKEMGNLTEISLFIKDWKELKITNKLLHNIKNGGMSGLIKGAIQGIASFFTR